jgi:hypothetical protein
MEPVARRVLRSCLALRDRSSRSANPGVERETELENDAAEELNEHLAILVVANDWYCRVR